LPSVVTGWIDDLRPVAGEHVVQIGTGMGFYSALLSHLVGGEGKVTSFETNCNLARLARRHLSNYNNVEVREEDGIAAVQKADVILSHVGTSTLPVNLINNLNVGGRAILTLSSTSNSISDVGIGAAFLFEKVTEDSIKATFSGFPFITTASCERSSQDELVIDNGFEQGGWEEVKSLTLGETELPPEHCWIQGKGWSLSKNEVEA
jgi:protein-L-isoaspartate(D-aspartate) O-methyltransferase